MKYYGNIQIQHKGQNVYGTFAINARNMSGALTDSQYVINALVTKYKMINTGKRIEITINPVKDSFDYPLVEIDRRNGKCNGSVTIRYAKLFAGITDKIAL